MIPWFVGGVSVEVEVEDPLMDDVGEQTRERSCAKQDEKGSD